jgi:hypothetical protein
MPRGSACAEIGVWKGDFSAEILRVVGPSRLYLVDPWEHEAGETYQHAWYGGGCAGGQAEMDRIHASVAERFAPAIASGTVEILRLDSGAAARSLPDQHLDWVYIDGNHTYEVVRDDLASYYPKVKPGGLLTGDDHRLDGWWGDGVVRAVSEFVATGRCRLVSIEGAQFVLQKTS